MTDILGRDRLQAGVLDVAHTSGIRGSVTFQCPFTNDCQNNKCLWKQRDCLGRSVWYVHDNPEHYKQQDEITKEFGEPYFPQWRTFAGTNCMMLYCTGMKLDGKFPNKQGGDE